jgi:hypothetical protein
MQALKKLVCSDTPVGVILSLVLSMFTLLFPFTFILIPYSFTLFSFFYIVMKIHSVEAWLKAFSTCGSHPIVIIQFYVTVGYMYLKAQSYESQEEGGFQDGG